MVIAIATAMTFSVIGATGAHAGQESEGPTLSGQSVIAGTQALNYTPYDYAHITTAAKCAARIAMLKPDWPAFAFRCDRQSQATCPKPTEFWHAMIAARDGSRMAVDAFAPAPAQPAAMAC